MGWLNQAGGRRVLSDDEEAALRAVESAARPPGVPRHYDAQHDPMCEVRRSTTSGDISIVGSTTPKGVSPESALGAIDSQAALTSPRAPP
jgi:hypothetical protein